MLNSRARFCCNWYTGEGPPYAWGGGARAQGGLGPRAAAEQDREQRRAPEYPVRGGEFFLAVFLCILLFFCDDHFICGCGGVGSGKGGQDSRVGDIKNGWATGCFAFLRPA